MNIRLFFSALLFLFVQQVIKSYVEEAGTMPILFEEPRQPSDWMSYLPFGVSVGILILSLAGLCWGGLRYSYSRLLQTIIYTYGALTLSIAVLTAVPNLHYIAEGLTVFWQMAGASFFLSLQVLFWGLLVHTCSFRQAGASFPLLALGALFSSIASFQLLMFMSPTWWSLTLWMVLLGLAANMLIRSSEKGDVCPRSSSMDATPWKTFILPVVAVSLGATLTSPLLRPIWMAVLNTQYPETNAVVIYMAHFQLLQLLGWLLCGLALIILSVALYRKQVEAWRLTVYALLIGVLCLGSGFLSQCWLSMGEEAYAASLGKGLEIFSKSLAEPLIQILAYVALTGLAAQWRFTALITVQFLAFWLLPQLVRGMTNSIWSLYNSEANPDFVYVLLLYSSLLFLLLMISALVATHRISSKIS